MDNFPHESFEAEIMPPYSEGQQQKSDFIMKSDQKTTSLYLSNEFSGNRKKKSKAKKFTKISRPEKRQRESFSASEEQTVRMP